MKAVAGTLKLDLAQFRELEAFATFGSELDAVSAAQLARGYRLVELLKQPLNAGMAVEDQVVSIFAGTRGYLDDIPVADVRRFEAGLLEFVRSRRPEIGDEIRTKGTLPGGVADAIDAFKATFVVGATDAGGPAADPTATDAEGVAPATSAKTLETE
jgi:F-type H+-transporting ATPase subunit alpha